MPATALVTSEQFLALPEEFDRNGNRIKDELIGGEIVKMPPASSPHDLIKSKIHEILAVFLRANQQLKLTSIVEYGLQIDRHNTFIADGVIVSKSRLPTVTRIFQGAPELAIEVVSPSDTVSHMKSKVDAYLRAGSSVVWVVFPESKSVVVYSGDSMHEVKGDEKIEIAILPGFSVPVAEFFELT